MSYLDCLKHSNLLTVNKEVDHSSNLTRNNPFAFYTNKKNRINHPFCPTSSLVFCSLVIHPTFTRIEKSQEKVLFVKKVLVCKRNPTTSFSTTATITYAIGAGITAAAGTRLALQWLSLCILTFAHSNHKALLDPVSIFFVTTSRIPDWVICAPAAFLGSVCHF